MSTMLSHDRIRVTLDPSWIDNLERSGLELKQLDCVLRPDQLARQGANDSFDGAPKWISWADDRMGVFVADLMSPAEVAIDLVASTDVFAMRICGPTDRSYRLDSRVTKTEDAESVLVFLPKGTNFGILSTKGIKGVTLLADAGRLATNIGVSQADLPRTLREYLTAGAPVAEKLKASVGTQRIAKEIADYAAKDRCAGLYLEGKCRQLMWSVLDHLYRDEALDANDGGAVSERDLKSLAKVRVAIEADPCGDHSIEYFARVAAMNRTKLRSAFKQVYGQTISQYRTSLRMSHADRLLRESELPISQIGFELGYADTSSFFVAFKKFFGQSPGRHRHH
jgi:AraC-like DNA-binding protein